MKYSAGRTFAFFGTLGWTLASIACSASSNSTGVSSTGGYSSSGVGTGGNAYNAGVGGSANLNKVLQDDGTMLLLGTIRDFHPTFADMEPCTNSPGKHCDSGHTEQNPTPSDPSQNCGVGSVYPNSCFIQTTIGSDSKPMYVTDKPGGTVTTTGPDNFHYWFNDQDGVNLSAQLPMLLSPNPDGITWSYANDAFFPIDNALFGPEGQVDGTGTPRNYGFTTEFHIKFTYKPGQTFYFKGDDDLLVFIAGQLAVDRSGIHNAQDATLNLDSLGLSSGTDYQFDLFYCERHRTLSEITITTSMEFTVPVGIN